MINLEKIYSYVGEIIRLDDNLNINQFTFGDIYKNLNQSECKYSAINMSLVDIQHSNNTVLYKFNIFYVDKLLEDRSNESAIIDNSYQIIMRLLNSFSNGCDELKGEAVDIEVSSVYTPFTENFADLCAGCYVEVTFQVLNYVGTCSDVVIPIDSLRKEELVLEINEEGTFEFKADENVVWDSVIIKVIV